MLARTIPAALAALAVAAPAAAQSRRPEWEAHPWQIGPRLSHLHLTDVETQEELDLGGLGAYVRWRVSRRFALEGSMEILAANERFDEDAGDGTVTRVTVPMVLSALFHLFPEGDFQLYGLLGLGVAGTALEYEELGERVSFASPVFQVGLGARLQLGDRLILDASLRGLTLNQRADAYEREPLDELPGTTVATDYGPRLGDRQVSGGMLTIGVLFGL